MANKKVSPPTAWLYRGFITCFLSAKNKKVLMLQEDSAREHV